MIAIDKKPRRALTDEERELFVGMLPQIRFQAQCAFRRLSAEEKEELVQEVVANSFVAFVRLVERGKTRVAFAAALADFAIRQVIDGRRVGSKQSARDVMSAQAHKAYGFIVERLGVFDEGQGQWCEALVEDRRAGPAETAAARIDVADWLRSVPKRNRRIAKMLATGETTSEVARQFDLSHSRVSQLREELRVSWSAFQGEVAQPTSTGEASQRDRTAAVA